MGGLQPMSTFKSDGCTNAFNGNFKHCCIQHDAYYFDGSVSRLKADFKLSICIVKRGNKNIIGKLWYLVVGIIYFIGVRIGGGKFWALLSGSQPKYKYEARRKYLKGLTQ